MRVTIIGNKICCKDEKIVVDDLFTEDFYSFSNEKADSFYNESYGVNEIYVHLVQFSQAIERWAQKNKLDRIDISKADERIYYYTKDICEKNHIYTTGYFWGRPIFSKIKYDVTVLSSAIYFIYLFLKIPYKPGIESAPKFSVLRTKASIKKFKKFGEIQQEIEDPFSKDSIYRLFPKCLRLKWVFRAYIASYRSFKKMSSFYGDLVGTHFRFALMDFYKKRIIHTEIYRLLLDNYFQHFETCDFYTGNNLDRYSVIEDQTRVKYDIKSYCVPHGIEYGFKFPKGFSCDVFYAHCQYAADYLNRLYKTDKHVYDEEIIRRMFEYNYSVPHEKMVIFFTEPREVKVNLDIVNELLPKLQKDGIRLFLKLHPGDNKSNYDGLDVEYITDYDLSMTGNICISRKSTILIEAIYNHSLPVAIITTPKDLSMFNTFPSLNSEKIVKVYNVDDLYTVIKENINETAITSSIL